MGGRMGAMAVPPDLDGRGKSQRNRSRKPTEETLHLPTGPVLVDTLDVEKAQARDAQQPGGLLPVDVVPVKLTRAQRASRQQVQEALSLRAGGWSVHDIAEHMEVTPSTVTRWFTEHRHSVKTGKVDRDLDAIAVPLAKENLIHGLIAGDKDYTLETLKGRGFFRRHVAGETEVKHDLPPLVIRFEGAPTHVPEAGSGEKFVTGTVVGSKSLPPADTTRTETVDVPVGVGVPSRPHDADRS